MKGFVLGLCIAAFGFGFNDVLWRNHELTKHEQELKRAEDRAYQAGQQSVHRGRRNPQAYIY